VDEALLAHRVTALIGYANRALLKDALGATLAKSWAERQRFDDVFEQFFNPPQANADPVLPSTQEPADDEAQLQMLLSDQGALTRRMQEAAQRIDVQQIEMLGQRHIYIHRLMREMGMDALERELQQAQASGDEARLATLRQARQALQMQARNFVQHQLQLYGPAKIRARHEAVLRERRLGELDLAERGEMLQLARRLARRLAHHHAQRRRQAQRGQLALRQTLRHNLRHEGNLVNLHWRRQKRNRPRLVVICDVSRSVAAYTQFLLLFVHSLAEVISRTRCFVFCADVAEVDDLGSSRFDLQTLAEMSQLAPQGPTHYGQMLITLTDQYLDAFTPRTTVLILGDARNNQLPDEAARLKQIQQRVRNILWFNPEPAARWDQGDSVLASYRPFCASIRECGTLAHLEAAVDHLLTQWQRVL
jgi:uncharacterized protein with von Willebrand factor type A (vWA) domain